MTFETPGGAVGLFDNAGDCESLTDKRSRNHSIRSSSRVSGTVVAVGHDSRNSNVGEAVSQRSTLVTHNRSISVASDSAFGVTHMQANNQDGRY